MSKQFPVRLSLLFLVGILLCGSYSVAVLAADTTVVSDQTAARAMAAAARYADVRYTVDGNEREGVAYKWGGRMSVEEYLAAVAAGARPAIDAGVDASAVAVNAYLAADPELRFVSGTEGRTRRLGDATSRTLYKWNVTEVPVSRLRPGDLIFFKGTSGGVAGVGVFEKKEGPNVYFVVASQTAKKVIHTFLNVNHAYWQSRFLAAGQLLQNQP